MRFVSVVISTRSPLSARARTSAMRSSTWTPAGRTVILGSMSPVGRMICSATDPPSQGVPGPDRCPPARASSYGPGVAET